MYFVRAVRKPIQITASLLLLFYFIVVWWWSGWMDGGKEEVRSNVRYINVSLCMHAYRYIVKESFHVE